MIRQPPRSTHCISSAASDVYKRQTFHRPERDLSAVDIELISRVCGDFDLQRFGWLSNNIQVLSKVNKAPCSRR